MMSTLSQAKPIATERNEAIGWKEACEIPRISTAQQNLYSNTPPVKAGEVFLYAATEDNKRLWGA